MRRMFSEQQIEKLVEDGANEVISDKGLKKVVANPTLAGTEAGLSGLQVGSTKYSVAQGLEGQDVVVKTIEQTQPNWSVDLSEVSIITPTGYSAQNIFSRVQVVNNELEVIFTFSITNNQESSGTPANAQLGSFDIPEKYGSKIIDLTGKPLTESVSLVAIAGARMVNSPSSPAETVVFGAQYGLLNLSHQATKLFIAAYGMQSIPAGATHTYSGRIQLTLL